MQIKCNYCGNFIEDTKEVCPHCGAINENYKRVVGDQPQTIEQLKEWYRARGLPEAHVTRFFIGEDYKGARAFGIYQDPYTEEFVVYKNKDNGQRAVRYQGKDEAYAVNEIYMRLKQEILQQKSNNIKKRQSGRGSAFGNYSTDTTKSKSTMPGPLKGILICLGVVVGGFGSILALGALIMLVEITPGYYSYDGKVYYRLDNYEAAVTGWYVYEQEQEEWTGPIFDSDTPEIMKEKDTCKEYLLSEEWNSKLTCPDFMKSISYQDAVAKNSVQEGYFKSGDDVYYHLANDYDSQWYYYDGEWESIDKEKLPNDFSHASTVNDFYFTPTWDKSTQYTDFTDSSFYEEYQKSQESSQDDDSSYDWDSGDSWDSDSTDWSSDW